VRLGNRQLTAHGKPAADGPLRLGSLLALVPARTVSPLDAACYLGVLLADRMLSRRRTSDAEVDWSRDGSSRG